MASEYMYLKLHSYFLLQYKLTVTSLTNLIHLTKEDPFFTSSINRANTCPHLTFKAFFSVL